jgi:aspartyl-tRNA(Asn)/glutamyl-tRNA(Gln) amidotransferase subunit B
MEYETVIGLEAHVQLATKSKIFCGASTAFGGLPNSNVDPVTLGLPGSLPMLNLQVVEYAIKLGLATQCEIRPISTFARKHYFYPDLPKGYQISQFDEPLCERGSLTITLNRATRTIGLKRIHLEEDAGKNIHDGRSKASLIDLNRAGTALLEVVSEPDLRSPEEASTFMRTLRQLVRYLGISDGNMEEGSLRCDANISLRPIGSPTLGTRTEIKNINSFKFVEKALEYEIARQHSVLKSGGVIRQQTLLFNSETGTTHPMRGKEESADYRYFPDPDLPQIHVDESWIARVKAALPLLPQHLVARLVTEHGLTDYDAHVLTSERVIYDYFEEVVGICNDAKSASNWITTELFGLLNKQGLSISESPVSAPHLGALLLLVKQDILSGKMAKTVFEEMFSSGKSPEVIVSERGLQQNSNREELTQIAADVLSQNSVQVQSFLGGQERVFGFLVGEVMKATKGSANPKAVNEILRERLAKLASPK